ncbi:hypothetical protein KAW48_02645 [candidate division WOR-3 bacterium]|nr:hypothetical protein [candidate division WOR-3 bacterium]
METTFPDRYFLLIVIILFIAGCGSKREYEFNPCPVYTEIVAIDSFYTTTEYISTGGADSLFCGEKSPFDSYSLIQFDSLPDNVDSLFLNLKSDSLGVELQFFSIDQEWFEDSLYKWEDIGWLIDTLTVLDSSFIDTADPVIKLDTSVVTALNQFGIAIHSGSFYSFASREQNEPKLTIYEGDTSYSISCLKDLYLIKNPFDSLQSDTMMVGRGLFIRSHLFIPTDPLPQETDNFARAGVILNLDDAILFNVIGFDVNGNQYSSTYYSDSNFIEIDFKSLFQAEYSEDYLHIMVGAHNGLEGIAVKTLNSPSLKMMWAEMD